MLNLADGRSGDLLSINERTHAVTHYTRNQQYERRCTGECENDRGRNALYCDLDQILEVGVAAKIGSVLVREPGPD